MICMKLSSKFGHFRKWYTTTSSATYIIPPPTAVAGILAATAGYTKKHNADSSYFQKLRGENFAVVLEHTSLITQRVVEINRKTKRKDDAHHKFRILHLLRNPSYIICYKGLWENIIANNLMKRTLPFPVYMGLTEFHANIQLLDVLHEQQTDDITVDNALFFSDMTDVVRFLTNINPTNPLNKKRLNLTIQNDHVVLGFDDYRRPTEFGIMVYAVTTNNKKQLIHQSIKLKSEFTLPITRVRIQDTNNYNRPHDTSKSEKILNIYWQTFQ